MGRCEMKQNKEPTELTESLQALQQRQFEG